MVQDLQLFASLLLIWLPPLPIVKVLSMPSFLYEPASFSQLEEDFLWQLHDKPTHQIQLE